jgi:hypothetical protein
LRRYQVGDLVVDSHPKEENSVGNQPREHVYGAKISRALFYYVLRHRFNLMGISFNFVCVAVNGIAAHAEVVYGVFPEFIVIVHKSLLFQFEVVAMGLHADADRTILANQTVKYNPRTLLQEKWF